MNRKYTLVESGKYIYISNGNEIRVIDPHNQLFKEKETHELIELFEYQNLLDYKVLSF